MCFVWVYVLLIRSSAAFLPVKALTWNMKQSLSPWICAGHPQIPLKDKTMEELNENISIGQEKAHKFISSLSCQRLAVSSLLSQECKYCSIPEFWPGYYKMSLVPSHAGSSSSTEWADGPGNTQVRGNPKSLQAREFWGSLCCFLCILVII